MATRLVTKTEEQEVTDLVEILRRYLSTDWSNRGFEKYIKKYSEPRNPMKTIIQAYPQGLKEMLKTLDNIDAKTDEVFKGISEIGRSIGEGNPNISVIESTGYTSERPDETFIELAFTLSLANCFVMAI